MKAKDGKAVEHLVPITQAMQQIIASLPRYRGGKYLFSLAAGVRALAMTGPIKSDLDRRMQRTLEAIARRRGEDHEHVTLPHWVNHDLRRVVRSGLSALRVEHVAEAILAHRPPGIVRTYNLHEYEDEKAEALEAWAQRLATIVNPVLAASVASCSSISAALRFRGSSGYFTAVAFRHADVLSRILAIDSMQSCLSFKIIFLFLLLCREIPASLLTSNSRRERAVWCRWNSMRASELIYSGRPKMAQSTHAPEDGKQVPARPHDPGSQANETVDGVFRTHRHVEAVAELWKH
jgi:hypothetical protein